MKSTHTGHCQICGRKQMLPGGKLSKHGYNVKYGFFNGTCKGAGHLPFEQDKTLVEESIEWAGRMVIESERRAAEIRANVETVWVSEYVPATWTNRRSHTQWREMQLNEVNFGYRTTWTGLDGKQHETSTYETSWNKAEDRPNTDEETRIEDIKQLNDRYAKLSDRDAKEYASYKKFQEGRIKDWKVQPLEPIK